ELEIAPPSRAPLLVFFPTINTHTPFAPAPPYQSDWGRMLSTAPYDAAELEASLAERPEWTNMQPAYAESVKYTLTFLGGYLRAHADSDSVLVILGDHQPQASV